MVLAFINKKHAKIQNFMQINSNTLSLHVVKYLLNASLHI
ncbi:hypothetical protein FORMB_13900 [Formosa sp. Hel1_33_131]|nr:hypothetical protein FORMB_13900 [Formosa sp. Hel1_33_131]